MPRGSGSPGVCPQGRRAGCSRPPQPSFHPAAPETEVSCAVLTWRQGHLFAPSLPRERQQGHGSDSKPTGLTIFITATGYCCYIKQFFGKVSLARNGFAKLGARHRGGPGEGRQKDSPEARPGRMRPLRRLGSWGFRWECSLVGALSLGPAMAFRSLAM